MLMTMLSGIKKTQSATWTSKAIFVRFDQFEDKGWQYVIILDDMLNSW